MTDRDAFQLSLIARVPVPPALIDALWWQMKNDPAHEDLNAHLEVLSDELRTEIACTIAERLCGLVYTCGDSLYWQAESAESVVTGKKFAFTVNKQLTAEVEVSLLFRLWHVGAPMSLLDGVYDWYVRATQNAPELFRRDEWEFSLEGSGELVVRLTGHVKPKPKPRPQREKAKVAKYGQAEAKKQ